jgi:predicted nucleic acid-binding protein
MNPVLDASAFVAATSPAERHHERARQLFESLPDTSSFLVPGLFRVEVVAALSRRGEPLDLVDAIDALIRGPRFVECPLDDELLEHAVTVARVARLRAYDAVYVALALHWEQPILTLDQEVIERSTAKFTELRIFGAA